MMQDIVHKAHLVFTAALAASGIGYIAVAHKSVDAFSVDHTALVQALGDMPRREVSIMCAPGCGGRAKIIAKAFSDVGWPAKVSAGMASDPNTLHIFSLDTDVYKASDGIGKAASLPVIFFAQEPDAGKIEILVGPVEDAQ